MKNREIGIKIIKELNLFDEDYYLDNYGNQIKDNQNLLTHYIDYGYKEGKNPSKDFDTLYYLRKYPDVVGWNPLIHYAIHGKQEHRFSSLNMELNYIEKGILEIKNQNLFDEGYYLKNYGKTIGDADPLTHYISFGYKEGKNPSSTFNNDFYLNNYPDTRGGNPLIHYALYGRKKGYYSSKKILNFKKDINKCIEIIKDNNLFNHEYYLDKYEDIYKSGCDPLIHYIEHGFSENREMLPVYDFKDYINKTNISKDINPLIHYITNGNDINKLKII